MITAQMITTGKVERSKIIGPTPQTIITMNVKEKEGGKLTVISWVMLENSSLALFDIQKLPAFKLLIFVRAFSIIEPPWGYQQAQWEMEVLVLLSGEERDDSGLQYTPSQLQSPAGMHRHG